MRLTWRQIEAFRAFMITGTVTRAAEMLCISQPAASALLSNLEHQIGYKLLDRQHGRLIPTPEAESLFAEVERSYISLNDISAAAYAIGQLTGGQLRLVALPALAATMLDDALCSFMQAHPSVAVIYETQARLVALNWVATHRADVGIVSEPAIAPGVCGETLLEEEAVCLIPRGHRLAGKEVISPVDLHGENLITLPPETRVRRQLDLILEREEVAPIRKVQCRTTRSVWELVERGVGLGVVASFRMSGPISTRLAVRPFRPTIRIGVHIVTSDSRRPSRIVTTFCEHLRSVVLKASVQYPTK